MKARRDHAEISLPRSGRDLTVRRAVRAECCLCMEKFVDTDELRVLPCNHFFHKARR